MRTLGSPLIRMGEVTSTMDIARRLESFGAPEGVAVIAASQTHGRGRSDRIWQSPPGSGLYCSILLRPNISADKFRPFSIAAGLAICDAIDPDHSLNLKLKWPNDIVIREKKLGGILITSVLTAAAVTSAIIGIGLNLYPNPDRPSTAISLSEVADGRPPTFEYLLPSIFTTVTRRYDAILTGEPETALIDWRNRLAYIDQLITLQEGSTIHAGVLHGLDPSGALLLATHKGILPITTGELNRGPRPLDRKERMF